MLDHFKMIIRWSNNRGIKQEDGKKGCKQMNYADNYWYLINKWSANLFVNILSSPLPIGHGQLNKP